MQRWIALTFVTGSPEPADDNDGRHPEQETVVASFVFPANRPIDEVVAEVTASPAMVAAFAVPEGTHRLTASPEYVMWGEGFDSEADARRAVAENSVGTGGDSRENDWRELQEEIAAIVREVG